MRGDSFAATGGRGPAGSTGAVVTGKGSPQTS